MHGVAIAVAVVVALTGGFLAVWALTGSSVEADAVAYLGALDDTPEASDQYSRQLSQPFLRRVIRPLGTGVLSQLGSLTPSNYLDSVHAKLLQAGLAGQMRAEEFATAQFLLTALGAVAVVLWAVVGSPRRGLGVLILVLVPLMCAMAPTAWLNRRVGERKDAIFKDLPDILDLLAISVEAGLGFEQALDVVCRHFTSPLAEEFSRTLKEMELGLPRKEALHNLKRRTEVPELSNFVLALTQADALGMPIGRILRTQAVEMRSKRRQWAREKAGKLPVKILFPLVGFIFPAVLIVILGPAASSIAKAFH